MSTLADYLQMHVRMRRGMRPDLPPPLTYWGSEDFVLDQGTTFASEPLTEDDLGVLLNAIACCPVGRFQMKNCYYNSQMVVLTDHTGQLEYTEGYAIGRSIPCPHGWITINGKVIDLTWRTERPNHKGRLRDRIFGVLPEHWTYIGVPFDTKYVRTRLTKHGEAASLIDDWKEDYPCFKRERNAPCDIDPLVLPTATLTFG
jgi:hypothetical protein